MNYITIKANAKLNLCLNITNVKSDGYHEIDSIFQSVHLFDLITIEKATGITLSCSDPKVPLNEKNTCYKMAALMMEQYNLSGVKIDIKKRIPSSAGLGGASADAACVLMGINTLFDLKLDDAKLNALGKKIGADVPFFLMGGSVHVTGIGEKLKKITNPFDFDIIIIKPYGGVSTPKSYAHFDKTGVLYKKENQMIKAFNDQDKDAFILSMRNDLEPSAFALQKNCKKAYTALKQAGALNIMVTGSGSCVFGLFLDGKKAMKTINLKKFQAVFLTKKAANALKFIKSD